MVKEEEEEEEGQEGEGDEVERRTLPKDVKCLKIGTRDMKELCNT